MQRYLQIFDVLRKEILSGEIPKGTILRQEALAQRFRTSRMPVREALRLLAAQGLVSQQHYRGATVMGDHHLRRKEWLELRRVLQSHAVRATVPGMSEGHLDRLGMLLDEVKLSTSASSSLHAISQAEVDLHLAMVTPLSNRAMVLILRNAIRRSTLEAHALRGRPLELLTVVVAHCRAARPAAAARALRSYLCALKELAE